MHRDRSRDAIEQEYSAEELKNRLQGTITAEKVLDQIEFRSGMTDNRQEMFKTWIMSLEEDSLKMGRFLKLVTGVPGLGTTRVVVDMKGQQLTVSTCFNMLCLPELEWDEVIKELEISLVKLTSFTRD